MINMKFKMIFNHWAKKGKVTRDKVHGRVSTVLAMFDLLS